MSVFLSIPILGWITAVLVVAAVLLAWSWVLSQAVKGIRVKPDVQIHPDVLSERETNTKWIAIYYPNCQDKAAKGFKQGFSQGRTDQ